MRKTLILLALASGLWACGRAPETTVRIQGRVRTLGLQNPIPGAQVTIQWPANLGGGESALQTNSQGQYAVERTVRQRDLSCDGLAITVDAPGYASVYSRHTDPDCGNGLLNLDFTLHPVPR